jgi:hypothetical protein
VDFIPHSEILVDYIPNSERLVDYTSHSESLVGYITHLESLVFTFGEKRETHFTGSKDFFYKISRF